MEKKEHYKLYKAGKMWCTMALATVSVVAGMTVAMSSASADTTTAPEDNQTVQVDKGLYTKSC